MLRIKQGAIEITVDEATIGDELRGEIIAQHVRDMIPDGEYATWNTFGDLCCHVRSSSGLPFDPLTLHQASKEEVYAAYLAYQKLPKKLGVAWRKAVFQVEAAVEEAIGPLTVGDSDPNPDPAGLSISSGS